MAPDDREERSGEERFEKALAKHLRREAKMTGGSAAAACPDAETLAAYHERELPSEEMNSWKEHITACARCRNVLSILEGTEGVLAGKEDEEYVAAKVTPMAAAPSGRMLRQEPTDREMAATAPPPLERNEKAWKRGAYLRWLAPAGAIAAVLLVWVAIHERAQTAKQAGQPVLVAESKNAPSAPAADALRPAPGDDAKASQSEERSFQLSKTEKQGRAAPEQLKAAPKAARNERETPHVSANSVGGQRSTPEAENKDAQLSARPDTLREKAEPGVVDGRLDKKLEQAEASKAGHAPAPAKALEPFAAQGGEKGTFAARAAAPPVAEANAEAKQKEAAGLAAPSATLALRSENSKLFARTRGAGKRLISAPGGTVQWSAGPGGLILRSTDGGKTWTQQTSGVTADLVGGSAPSETICWIVGMKGTILLTTDGEHWTKVSPPTMADLTGVSARDDRNAAVWSDARLPRYVTQDGGRTWTQRGAE
jgi:hypothetical protein